ncbi:MAG TPA: nitronate monooxygenase [Gaiellaceae bacterium]|nr:nitronate monooxygenase [Gaiellaceae bacterium]
MSRLGHLLGVELPIVQAPIGTASVPRLAAAVSNAGGLGMLALSWTASTGVAAMIGETQALTERPFGINVVLEWDQRARVGAALAAGVRIVSLTWGDPAPSIELIHAAGGVALVTVGSAEEARRVEAAGADVVVARGWESGGHVWGQVSTMALVPAVVDAVAVPVIAAGGIADARGVAAALALGADGVWVGTRFLLAEETPIHPLYRERLLAASETDTVYSSVFDGGWPDAPHRTLRNSTLDAWEQAGTPSSGSRPREGEAIARRADGSEVARYASALPLAGMEGEIEALSLWAGQSVALARRVRPAAEIVAELAAGLR